MTATTTTNATGTLYGAGAVAALREGDEELLAGLFRCYESADLPRTNNNLEHLFGSHRYHERRASGRKCASSGLVVMGSVRVVAGLATRLRPEEGPQLPSDYVARWRETRAQLAKRREARRQQRRFRRAPITYLQKLEERADKLSLPP